MLPFGKLHLFIRAGLRRRSLLRGLLPLRLRPPPSRSGSGADMSMPTEREKAQKTASICRANSIPASGYARGEIER